MDVVAGVGGGGPVGMLVVLDGGPLGEDIFKLALPAMAALVGCQAVGHGAIGGLLQIEVEGGLDAEAVFVDFV